MMPNIVMIPGNGNSDVSEIWFPYVQSKLQEKGLVVKARNMPDPELARKEFWLPFILNELKVDQNTIAIGHSSGAVAIMRLLEQYKLLGSILVGACYTDLGYESERVSGYYSDPWKWDLIKNNSKRIIQFASQDDPYIPIVQARFIHEKLDSEYHEFTDEGHFGTDKNKTKFPLLVERVLSILDK